jgi:histidinol-phosphate phosphatase family protein
VRPNETDRAILRDVQPAVFLDREWCVRPGAKASDIGDCSPGEPDAVRLRPGVAAAVRTLRREGYSIVIATNQCGVAKGACTEEDVDAVNQRIAALIDHEAGEAGLIDRFYYCPYHPEASVEEYRRDHPWRKPHPGMMLQAARDLHLDLVRSWVVGETVQDIEAGSAAGCRTILVGGAAGGVGPVKVNEVVESLEDAVSVILNSGEDSAGSRASEPERETASGGAVRRSDSISTADASDEMRRMRRAVQELMEEMRTERLHRSEFTALRLLAGVVQLLVLLLVLLGLLELHNTEVFLKWMAGAVLVQLLVISLLVMDLNR